MTNEQLENLKRLEASLPNELVAQAYYSQGMQCYCVIGYALHYQCNVDLDKLMKMNDWISTYDNHTKKLQEVYGLSVEELSELQDVNDHYYENGKHERAIAVKAYLARLIKEKEAEIQ